MAKKPAPKPAPAPAPKPAPKPAPAPAPKPAPAPAPKPAPKPAPAPAPAPKPAPAPQPTPQQAAAILNAGGDTSKFNAATWEALKQIEAANNAAAARPPAPAPAPAPGPAPAPAPAFSPVTPPEGGRQVTLSYAQEVEGRVNSLLAEGKIEEARMQAGNITGGGAGVQNVLSRINTAIGAAESARQRVIDSQRQPDPEPEFEPRFDEPPGETEQDRYYKWLRDQQETQDAEIKRQQRGTAESFLRDILKQYGMESLSSQVESLIGTWGNNVGVIAERLRQTEEYKTRFKGLVKLQQKGVTDIRNEEQYLRFETDYRDIFRTAGLRDFLGASGSQQEIDAIANLVADYSVSVNEVRARVLDAQRVAAETPPEVRDALQRFYNVGAQDLVAYSLDPQRTMTRINEMANAAILGGFAQRGGLDIDVAGAERIAGLAGGEDINIERVTQDVSQAREIRDATRRLAEIERGTLQDIEVLEAQAGTSVAAGERIRTLQSRERARFGGSTAVGATTLTRGNKI